MPLPFFYTSESPSRLLRPAASLADIGPPIRPSRPESSSVMGTLGLSASFVSFLVLFSSFPSPFLPFSSFLPSCAPFCLSFQFLSFFLKTQSATGPLHTHQSQGRACGAPAEGTGCPPLQFLGASGTGGQGFQDCTCRTWTTFLELVRHNRYLSLNPKVQAPLYP